MLKKFWLKELNKGATAIEYALIVSLIAIIAIASLRTLGNSVRDKLNNIATQLDSAGTN